MEERERETEKVGMESNREKGRKMTLLEQQCGEREREQGYIKSIERGTYIRERETDRQRVRETERHSRVI